MKSNKIEGGAGSTSPSILLSAALLAVDGEPECPGEMPDEMYEVMCRDKDAMEEAMRIAVRLTKKGIRLRLEIAANSVTSPEIHE